MEITKSVLRKTYYSFPFFIRARLLKKILKRVDEIDVVFQLNRNRKNGIMIDVGAHYGESLRRFMLNNWKIYAFEPDRSNYKFLEQTVDKYDVCLDNRAVSNVSKQSLPFYTSRESTGISSLSNFHSLHKSDYDVLTVTLSDYIKENNINSITFLKIDTEGYDLFVLKGLDWENNPLPEFIVCEFEDKKTIPLGYSATDIVDFLTKNEYYVVISEWYPIIQYGTNHKWKRFLTTENINLLDPNSWGNLIAIRNNSTNLVTLKKIIKQI
jgi:FkbM family methyltransferase